MKTYLKNQTGRNKIADLLVKSNTVANTLGIKTSKITYK